MEHIQYNNEHDIQYRTSNDDDAAANYDGQNITKSSNNSILKDMNLPTCDIMHQPPSTTTMYQSDISTPYDHQQLCKIKRSAGSNSATNRFITNMSLICTVCTIILFSILALFYSEWGSSTTTDLNSDYTIIEQSFSSGEQQYLNRLESEFNQQHNNMMHRQLEQDNNQNQDVNTVADGDYSSYRCDDIFTNTQSTTYSSNNNDSSSSSTTTKRCQYASTCDNGDGVLFPFVFCHTNVLSTFTWLMLMSPILLLGLTLLFRLLGSTAEEYFSPSLEMFSIKLGLPPRFAGVTLLALGNGAADVSATMNAIANDPENGYKMSLGALTGAAMFITTVVAGSVILANDGVACRGALVRDVTALGVSVVVVALNLEKGEITAGTSSLFISLYVIFVLIVLVADVYHRAVMLPRIKHETEMREHQRQLEAERVASQRASDALNAVAASGGGGAQSVVSEGGGMTDNNADDRTHATAPQMGEGIRTTEEPVPQNRALNAVLTALSNYNDDELELDDDGSIGMDSIGHQRRPANGWGVESTIEGNKAWDRPIVLHGADGILTKHPHHPPQQQDGLDNEEFQSPYQVMEDMDLVDRVCIQEGSSGLPAYNWVGAYHDGKQELIVHFREYWRDIIHDDDSSSLEKFLLICEYPMTLARKLTVSIPCEGSYCRALVALSFALSPLWLGVYSLSNFDVNLWGWPMAVFITLASLVGLLIMRFAPGGDGTMATMLAVPIALYGFVVAATWIDWIADKLVSLLEFLGILLRIPNYIMGLTVLAWGNSMADLSANVTMARKGLANMAITACFAGPIFNILIGLGAGFSVLRSVTKTAINYVSLTPAITTGFVFCFINCGLLLVSGLAINKGVIPSGYGYAALGLYVAYIATSLLLQFLA